ncbi:MAG: ABC transporter permease, partial [Patulibacter sp.]
MISLALRNLLARKRRTLLTALAIIVGVAQVTGAFVLTDSMNKSVDEIFESGAKYVDVVVTPKGTGSHGDGPDGPTDMPTIPRETLARVKAVPGIEKAVGEVFALVTVLSKERKPITVGPPSFLASQSPEDMTSVRVTSGRWAAGPGEAVMERSGVERGGYQLGDAINVVGEEGIERPRLVGITASKDDGTS